MKKTILNSLTVVTLFFASAANAQVGVGVPAGDIHRKHASFCRVGSEIYYKRVFTSTYDES
jgi:hypothetical protein